VLIVFSTAVDYLCGLGIARSASPRHRRMLLIVSITTNLTLLGFFKYFLFINQSIAWLASRFGASYPAALLAVRLTLPVGISFYTFQSMSYTIDIYRGLARPTRSFLDFACYVSMFPQLVAGPIVRYTHLEQQLHAPSFSSSRIYAGIQFFILGLAKKVLLADSASTLADAVFGASQWAMLSSWDAVIGILAYAVQIYFDFSGYSDMAIGLGYFCGYEFPVNFNSPYKSLSITEFWRRWHMTLSRWLRDYLYIPLGGSRHGAWLTYRNLAATMLLGGLWHGASWHFVVWGAYHGALLALERALGDGNPLRRAPAAAQGLVTFALVNVGWALFRAEGLRGAVAVLAKAFGGDLGRVGLLEVENGRIGLAAVGVGLVVAIGFRNSWQISRTPRWGKTIFLVILLVVSIAFLFGAVSHPFLYYQF
jgi:alginate O-acetyltransferase complex protein AlgI